MQSIGEIQLVRYLTLEQKWGNLRFDFPSVNVEISHFGLSSLGHGASYGTKKLSVRSSSSWAVERVATSTCLGRLRHAVFSIPLHCYEGFLA